MSRCFKSSRHLSFQRRESKYYPSVFTKSVDSNFRAFWLAPVTWNILGYSLFCKRREKWRVFYPSDLVNTKTTIRLRVGEERWICTSTLRASVNIHHYSPPLRRSVVYYDILCVDTSVIRPWLKMIPVKWYDIIWYHIASRFELSVK